MKQTNVLSRRLVQRVILLSLIAILGLVFAIAASLWGTLRSIETQLNDAGQRAGRSVDQFLNDLESDLRATGDTLTVITDDMNEVFRRTLERQFAIFELILVDPQGEVLAQRRRAGVADLTRLTEQPWLTTVQAGQVYVGPVDFEEFGVPFVDLVVPVSDGEGNFSASLLAKVDLTALWNTIVTLEVGETGYAYITDDAGQLLAHHDLELVRRGVKLEDSVGYTPQAVAEPGIDMYLGRDGQRVAASGVSLETVPWFVIVEQPARESLGPFGLQGTGLLIALMFVGVLVANIVQFSRDRIASPLRLLREGVDAMSQGQLDQQIDIHTEDEFGSLARAFNSMTTQLRELIGSLEERVAARTERLEIVALLGERFGAILELEELLAQVVNQVKDSFGYYHAHIYLLDEAGENLVVTAGTGVAGAEMKARGHSIALDAPTSLVARAARTGQVVTVDNVREAEDWLPNPLLPDTYSEMAVPITFGEAGQVIGVLDVQQDMIAGLDESDANLLRSLASQVAVTMNNARLFQETQVALAEVEALNRRLTRETWQDIGQKVQTSGYVFAKSGLDVTPAPTEWLPAMTDAVQQRSVAHHAGDGGGQQQETSVAIPLTLRGEVIGAIGIERPPDRPWSEDELVTIQAVAEQVALALDAARLARETERAAWRDRVVSESTASVWASAELDEVMKAAVAQLGDKLRASEVIIRLGTESELPRE